jgi:hypothetical protein
VESRHRACSTTCYRILFEDWHSSARGKLVNSVARVSKALLLTLVCSASHSLAQTGAVTDFTGSLVPADKNGPELVGWRSVPTVAQISEVFPKGATNRGYLLWECRVQVDGRLDGCALQAQWPPNDDRYKVAAEKLLPLFRVDEQTVRLARGEDKAISFFLPIYRPGSKGFTPDECPPPFCVPVLPPPKS